MSALIKSSALALLMSAFTFGQAEAGCVPNGLSDASYNTCIGSSTLTNNTGSANTAMGISALTANTTGQYNTGIGAGALMNNLSNLNTAIGANTLARNTTGGNNTAAGALALSNNTTGSNNNASGLSALEYNTEGNYNSAIGVSSLRSNTTGNENVGLGFSTLFYNTIGAQNTALGNYALYNNTKGVGNISIGYAAGSSITTGSNNIVIGNSGVGNDSNTIRIGSKPQKKTFISGIRAVNVTGGQAVFVNADGQLGVTSSSRRYKQDIHPMGNASDPLMKLTPVTFRYKQAEVDGSRPLQYGLIAEEVAEVMPELAIYNKDGTPESVAYQVLPSLLLNEYKKQATELADTKAELADTKARLEVMEAEVLSMKLMLGRLAAAQSGKVQFASAP